MSDTSNTPTEPMDKPDGSTSDEQEFQNPETEEDTASGGPAEEPAN